MEPCGKPVGSQLFLGLPGNRHLFNGCHSVSNILFLEIFYLYNQVGRGDVAGQSAEVDSPFLMGLQLRILIIIQRDA